MTIRIRLPKNKTGPGRLSLYRTEYQPASKARSGERIPGHQRDIYLGSLPRFTPDDKVAAVLTYSRAQPAQVPLTAAELVTLETFLFLDAKNFVEAWPKELVASCLAHVEQKTEQQRLLEKARLTDSTATPVQRVITDMSGAAPYLAGLAAELKDEGKSPRELYKAKFVPLENAWKMLYKAVQGAGIVATRKRAAKSMEGGPQ